jgi:hypothetical protein
MPHHHVRVKTQGRVHDNFVRRLSHHRGQPARLARVHQEENGVVVLDKGLQLGEICLCLGFVQNRMSQHRDRQNVSLSIHAGIDFLESLGGTERLGLPPSKTVVELKQRLAHGVGERDGAIVDKRDLAHTPAHQVP